MCGGRGSRLDAAVEKPLFEVAGRPMIDRVLATLEQTDLSAVRAVTSPHAPATRRHVAERGITCIEAPGEGYVADLSYALDRVSRPALTVAADLPLLDATVVDRVLALPDGSRAVYVPAALKSALGVSYDRTTEYDGQTVVPAGINVIAEGTDRPEVSYDARYAVNVNRTADADIAERLLETSSETSGGRHRS